ncbi:hypothetical protein GcM1_222008 [Golovinomyces cichoracearum]|uniref:SAM domain-containing protein n=1 Tax=Golovinomyces cichoracearum TaxID=62708 RepID=A0A420IR48_9PEZI|nr:hypothetical protein GcM1_222008 [Golovinomyces cichoracearum]
MASDLRQILGNLDIEEEYHLLANAGFTTMAQLTRITEQDMANLNIRLGTRRKIQRAIAHSLGWPDSKPLPSEAELNRLRK